LAPGKNYRIKGIGIILSGIIPLLGWFGNQDQVSTVINLGPLLIKKTLRKGIKFKVEFKVIQLNGL